jgi:hypothetical protein
MNSKFTLLIAATLVLLACGGGRGSVEDEGCNDSVACIQPDPDKIVDSTNLNGLYRIKFNLSLNTCPNKNLLRLLSESFDSNDGVGYHGHPTIEMQSSFGVLYSGYASVENTDGKTYFSNIQSITRVMLDEFISGMTCDEELTLHLANITEKTVSARRDSTITCRSEDNPLDQNSQLICKVGYDGTGTFLPSHSK